MLCLGLSCSVHVVHFLIFFLGLICSCVVLAWIGNVFIYYIFGCGCEIIYFSGVVDMFDVSTSLLYDMHRFDACFC